MNLTITRGTVHLFTFKEGMLSAIAHDLQLTVKRFRVVVNGAAVAAELFTDTVVVDGAVRDGKLAPQVLSDRDRDKIRATMAGEVLRSSQFGRATFAGTATVEGDHVVARGELELVGKRQPIEVAMTRAGATLSGDIELVPSRWGIRPYSALGGTLRVQDRVRVVFTLEA